MGITELIQRVGEQDVRVQFIEQHISSVRTEGRNSHVTFATSPNHITPASAARGGGEWVPVLLWFPRPKLDEVRAEVVAVPAREEV